MRLRIASSGLVCRLWGSAARCPGRASVPNPALPPSPRPRSHAKPTRPSAPAAPQRPSSMPPASAPRSSSIRTGAWESHPIPLRPRPPSTTPPGPSATPRPPWTRSRTRIRRNPLPARVNPAELPNSQRTERPFAALCVVPAPHQARSQPRAARAAHRTACLQKHFLRPRYSGIESRRLRQRQADPARGTARKCSRTTISRSLASTISISTRRKPRSRWSCEPSILPSATAHTPAFSPIALCSWATTTILQRELNLLSNRSLFERLPRLIYSVLLAVLAVFLFALYFAQKGHTEYLWLALHELVQAPIGFIELAGSTARLDSLWYAAPSSGSSSSSRPISSSNFSSPFSLCRGDGTSGGSATPRPFWPVSGLPSSLLLSQRSHPFSWQASSYALRCG